MKVLVSGMLGHMGKEVVNLAIQNYRGAELVCGVDPMASAEMSSLEIPVYASFDEVKEEVDVIVDFSHHAATKDLVAYATAKNLPLVLATTGQTEEEKAMIDAASKEIPLFFAANYSLGVALLIDLAKKAAAMMPEAEIEIVEMHHDRKLDAPSGTALAIAKGIQEVRPEAPITTGRSGMAKRTKEEIGIQSVRLGNIVGIHEVLVGTPNQTITLKHEAHSRALFAEGALAAAAFLVSQQPGLYDMKSLI